MPRCRSFNVILAVRLNMASKRKSSSLTLFDYFKNDQKKKKENNEPAVGVTIDNGINVSNEITIPVNVTNASDEYAVTSSSTSISGNSTINSVDLDHVDTGDRVISNEHSTSSTKDIPSTDATNRSSKSKDAIYDQIKRKRAFQNHWIAMWPWIYFDQTQNKMFCK